ncbi:MAG: cytidylate kinase-like family protein [Acidobacteriota bacterium]
MLITLSRQYAAGGSRIARLVADSLGWQLVDNEFVEQVAERAGLTPEEVAAREEKPPSLIERLANVTAFELPELFTHGGVRERLDEGSLEQVTRSLVKDLAEQGNSVLVGRASAAVLARREDALHVRVVAGTEFRERHAQEAFDMTPQAAAQRRAEVDANRKRYHQDYYDRNVDDPTHYDLVLNSERLGWEGSAEVLVGRCRFLGWTAQS